jgi:hypothetical protein
MVKVKLNLKDIEMTRGLWNSLDKEEQYLIPGIAGLSFYFVGQALGFYPLVLGGIGAYMAYEWHKNLPSYVGGDSSGWETDFAKWSPMLGIAALGYMYPPAGLSQFAGLALGGIAGYYASLYLWRRYITYVPVPPFVG